jgi:soluble lytic murein transglycosylase-like protein
MHRKIEQNHPVPFMDCFQRAATKYQIDIVLLTAIAETESRFNQKATHKNRDGSDDIGIMQINTQWLPTLKKFGIEKQHLFEPCTNIDIAGWILAHNFASHGQSLVALGAYNAGFKNQPALNHIRKKYAVQILLKAYPSYNSTEEITSK